MEHYGGLLVGYGGALLAFWALWIAARPAWLKGQSPQFKRKWLELLIAFLAAAGVIGIGQLYMAGMLLPDEGELLQSLNQVLIFLPLLAVALWRGQVFAATYLPLGKAGPSLALGAVLAATAVCAYSAMRGLGGELLEIVRFLLHPNHLSLSVQVLLEDIAIAIFLARLIAAAGPRMAIVVVAALFQVAHIPAFLADGASLETLRSLVLDTGLGLMILGAVAVSRNVIWFWPLHTVMDLMQFYNS